MKIELQKAIDLYSARTQERNKQLGRALHYNAMNAQRIGMLLYPNSAYESISVSMSRLSTGKVKKISIDWIALFTKELGVDANFIFGQPSNFDGEYQRLCKNKL